MAQYYHCAVAVYDSNTGEWIEDVQKEKGNSQREDYPIEYVPQPELQIVPQSPPKELDITPFPLSDLEKIAYDPKKKPELPN